MSMFRELLNRGSNQMRKLLVTVFAFCAVSGIAQTAGPVQTASVTLTSAQLRSLHGSPVQLIAAPGTGQALAPISVVFQYKAGSSVYTIPGGGRLALYISAPQNLVTQVSAAGFLDQSTSQIFMSEGIGGIGSSPQGTLENASMMAANDGSTEWTNGDGTVTITVYYTIVALQ
jgi:hypothetical protein